MPELHVEDRLLVTDATHFRDYILTRYTPRCDPKGALHPASLLRHLLRQHHMLSCWPMLEGLRAVLGPEETVWGFKLGKAGASLELYLYNFTSNGSGNRKSTTALAKALQPWLRFETTVEETQPYFMCSFEVTAEGIANSDGGQFRIYVGTGEEAREPGGFSYRLEDGATAVENHYAFYRADDPRAMQDAVRRVVASPRSGAQACWGTLLPKWLREDCFTVCYAVKPRADGLYYSRIGTDALARFLARHGYGSIADVLRHHRQGFAALRWDLGFDYAASSSGTTSLAVDKIGIHGVW